MYKPFPYPDEAMNAGVGFSWPATVNIPVGFRLEGFSGSNVPAGFSAGSESAHCAGAGFTLEGGGLLNIPAGWTVRNQSMSRVPVGMTVALPSDTNTGIGMSVGIVSSTATQHGFSLMGLMKIPVNMIALDRNTLGAIPSQVPVRKDKNITLDGTDPEVLD